MKRFMKGCAITALIFGVIGVVFVMVGGAAAGSAAIYRTVEETTKGRVRLDGWWGMYPYGGLKSWIFGWMASDSDIVGSEVELTPEAPEIPEVPDVDNGYGGSGWRDGDDEGHVVKFSHSSKVYEGDVDKFCPGENIRNLEIEVGGCLLQTEISQDGKLYLEAEDVYKFQSYVEDHTLYVKSSSQYPTDIGEGSITLYLPENYRFHEVSVELGAGELYLPFLHADSASLEVGAGQIAVYDKAMISELDVSIGAGSVSFDAIEAVELDVEVGMGVFSAYEVEIGKSVNAECAMGSVEITLKGEEQDFNYDLECAMGNIELNGRDYGGFGQERSMDNGVSRQIDLDCSMGYIGISFTD